MLTEKKDRKNFLYDEILPANVFTPEDFEDEHIMLSDMATKFVMNEVYPKLEKIENQEFNETINLVKKAGELGLIGADIPEEDGGLELGKVCATIISEKMALGRSFSITFGGQTGIGALPIAYFGTKKQKDKYLPDILSGEKIAAYALTEPSSGTDAMSLKTNALISDCGKYYLLNGEKQWITNSAFADVFIVYAKVDGQKFTAFIVEKEYEGVSTSPEEKKMGLKGSSTRSLALTGFHPATSEIFATLSPITTPSKFSLKIAIFILYPPTILKKYLEQTPFQLFDGHHFPEKPHNIQALISP